MQGPERGTGQGRGRGGVTGCSHLGSVSAGGCRQGLLGGGRVLLEDSRQLWLRCLQLLQIEVKLLLLQCAAALSPVAKQLLLLAV